MLLFLNSNWDFSEQIQPAERNSEPEIIFYDFRKCLAVEKLKKYQTLSNASEIFQNPYSHYS